MNERRWTFLRTAGILLFFFSGFAQDDVEQSGLGAHVIFGAQQAKFIIVPEDFDLKIAEYENNGFEQRVELRNGELWVHVLVKNQFLKSEMRARDPFDLPEAFMDLKARLYEKDPVFFADQLAMIIGWIKESFYYRGKIYEDQSVETVLETGEANCIGLANLLMEILKYLKVQSRYVTGVALNPSDAAERTLEGAALHRWVEIKYDDVGWVFSEPAGKVNFVDATYLVLGVSGVHTIPDTLEKALGAKYRLLSLKDALKDSGRILGLDDQLFIRPNRVPSVHE